MEIKFWPRYLFAVLIGLSGIYYATAQMSDVPFVLSDSQMEQLVGADTYQGWACKEMTPCKDVLCNSLNLKRRYGSTGCKSCETASSNNNCTYVDDKCASCLVIYYESECGGWFDYTRSERDWHRKCN